MEHRSPAYRFTVIDKKDPRLDELRAECRKINETRGPLDQHLRISLKGRLGKGNPMRVLLTPSQKYHGNVPTDWATRWDVYVREEYTQKGHEHHWAEWRKKNDAERAERLERLGKQALARRIANQFVEPMFELARLHGVDLEEVAAYARDRMRELEPSLYLED
jgi:hypothetical protein